MMSRRTHALVLALVLPACAPHVGSTRLQEVELLRRPLAPLSWSTRVMLEPRTFDDRIEVTAWSEETCRTPIAQKVSKVTMGELTPHKRTWLWYVSGGVALVTGFVAIGKAPGQPLMSDSFSRGSLSREATYGIGATSLVLGLAGIGLGIGSTVRGDGTVKVGETIAERTLPGDSALCRKTKAPGVSVTLDIPSDPPRTRTETTGPTGVATFALDDGVACYIASLTDRSLVSVLTANAGRVFFFDLPSTEAIKRVERTVVRKTPEWEQLGLRPNEFCDQLVPKPRVPPVLTARATFTDANGDGVLDAEEAGEVTVAVSNTGKGDGHVKIDAHLKIDAVIARKTEVEVEGVAGRFVVRPGETVKRVMRLAAGQNVVDGKETLRIDVKDSNRFDADPIEVTFKTRALRPPDLVIAGIDVRDDGTGETVGNGNGLLERGENAELSITIANRGTGPARGVRVVAESTHQDVILRDTAHNLEVIQAGELKTVKVLAMVTKRYLGTNLPVRLAITEARPRFAWTRALPLVLGKRPMVVTRVDVAAKAEEPRRVAAKAGDDVDAPPPYRLREDKNAWAVIIGIESYKNAPPVPYAVRDAEAIETYFDHLGVPASNRFKKVGAAASLSAMLDIGAWLKRYTEDGARIYFYFSGHGMPDKDRKTALLVPYDGNPQNAETLYPLSKLQEAVSKLEGPAREVLVLLDSCFSGLAKDKPLVSLVVGPRPLALRADSLMPVEKNTKVLTASGPGELANAWDQGKHGLFTYHLLKCLRGGTAKGAITVEGLYGCIAPSVEKDARRLERDQRPQMTGGADFVLVDKRGKGKK